MTAKLSVQLLERIAGIGKPGDIVEVSHAQAMNFLIPKKKAIIATKAVIEAEKNAKKHKQESRVRTLEERHTIAEILGGKDLPFTLRGKGDSVFGGIGEHEILKKIESLYKVELERKHIVLPGGHHIKKSGTTDIVISLSDDTFVRMHVIITV